MVHPWAIGQVDYDRTIIVQVFKPEATLLSVPLTFCLDYQGTMIKTHLQRHSSQNANRNTRPFVLFYHRKEGLRIPLSLESAGFLRKVL
jgi:hypothetical protein